MEFKKVEVAVTINKEPKREIEIFRKHCIKHLAKSWGHPVEHLLYRDFSMNSGVGYNETKLENHVTTNEKWPSTFFNVHEDKGIMIFGVYFDADKHFDTTLVEFYRGRARQIRMSVEDLKSFKILQDGKNHYSLVKWLPPEKFLFFHENELLGVNIHKESTSNPGFGIIGDVIEKRGRQVTTG